MRMIFICYMCKDNFKVNWEKESVMNIKIAEEKDFDDVKKTA